MSGPPWPRVRLTVLLPVAAAVAALGITAVLLVPDWFGGAPAAGGRAAAADRAALDALAEALRHVPAARLGSTVRELETGFSGRLLVVGGGSPSPAPDASLAGFAVPLRMQPGGRQGWRDVAGGFAALAGAPLPASGPGAGLLSIVRRAAPPAGRGMWFAFLFGVIVVGAALVPAMVLAQRLRADLRRIEQGLRGLASRESDRSPAGTVAPERRELPEANDELGLVAWSYESVRDRFAEEVARYRRARDRLARADQDKIDFLAVMSHELRTPLNTILGFSEVLLEGLEGPLNPGQREDLRIIRESGDHLLGLVNDILDLSALQAGQIRAEFVGTDLVEIARAVLVEAEGQLRGKPVRLLSDFAVEKLPLRGDARLLRRVLQNLVGNALKFTQQGEVRLTLRTDGAQITAEVTDTGPGIAPEALSAIFEEYRQAGDARARREGTGLGLAIARRFVEMHGGTITAASKLGHGSTFTVRLPAAGAPERDGHG